MRLFSSAFIFVIIIVIICDVPPSCIVSAHSTLGDDVTDDVITRSVSDTAGDVTRSVQVLEVLLRSRLCKKRLARDKLDDSPDELKV